MTPEETQRALDAVAAFGEELWDEVVPELFKSKLWPEVRKLQESGKVRSLLITSDEPWMPWEMVKPYVRDEVAGTEESLPYWAESFQIARWLAGRGTAGSVEVVAARLVAPELDLAYVEDEKRAYEAMAQNGVGIAPPLQKRSEVQALIAEGGVQLVHIAAHGSFDAEDPARSKLTLADGSLTPEDLSPSATKGLRAARPLVFINACSVGRLGLSLTGLGGWADKLVNVGRVGAFIGTLWEVNDRLAAAFAQHFYERLFAGDTLGEAFHAARLHTRDLDPANPTWLAYTLYGDPNAVIRPPQS
jgi:CHAT domain-containing protein